MLMGNQDMEEDSSAGLEVAMQEVAEELHERRWSHSYRLMK